VAIERLTVVHQIQVRDLSLAERRMVFHTRVENGHGDFLSPPRAITVSADSLQESFAAEGSSAATSRS
jgi:hypothetical protein